jgi:hypothetical protein
VRTTDHLSGDRVRVLDLHVVEHGLHAQRPWHIPPDR